MSVDELKQYCFMIADELNVEQVISDDFIYTRACPYHNPVQEESLKLQGKVVL